MTKEDFIILSLVELANIAILERDKLTNVEKLYLMYALEEKLIANSNDICNAILSLNKRSISVNTSPALINSYLQDIYNIINNVENKDTFNLEYFNNKHSSISPITLIEHNSKGQSTVVYTGNIEDNNYIAYNTRYICNKLVPLLGLENYLKFLLVLLFLNYADSIRNPLINSK